MRCWTRRARTWALRRGSRRCGRLPGRRAVTGARRAREESAEATTTSYIPPMPGEYFDIVLLQADVPIVEKRYVLVLPADKRLHQPRCTTAPLYSRTAYDADSTDYALVGGGRARPPARAAPARRQRPLAKVVMATGRELGGEVPLVLRREPQPVRGHPRDPRQVDESWPRPALADASDPTEGRRGARHWVAQNIRYSGQTMGEGEGFTLHPGNDDLRAAQRRVQGHRRHAASR